MDNHLPCRFGAVFSLIALVGTSVGCSSDGSPPPDKGLPVQLPSTLGSTGGSTTAGGPAGGGTQSTLVAGRGSAGSSGAAGLGAAALGAAGNTAPPSNLGGSVAPPPMPPAAGSGGPVVTAGAAAPLPPAKPDDGDPSQPIVAVPGVACGPNPSVLGLTATNVKIGDRDVHVAYPCNKHKGAPATFILNLHGTMEMEAIKLYQVAYFSANNLVNSHNFITAAPKSVVAQWGNGDGGVDEPHIMAVIDWVYSTFKDFDIRSMWVGGHSWGAMYTSTFACKPALADRVKGIIIMSGNPVAPACSSKVALIDTNAEMDIAAPLNQGTIPMTHGCGAMEMHMLGNNAQTLWPNCKPGFVHSNYLMLGKGHIDYMDAEVVKSIADLINSVRP